MHNIGCKGARWRQLDGGLEHCDGCCAIVMRCRYCYGGYCNDDDVRLVELRTRPGGTWNGGISRVGKKCREYLRGHFRYVKYVKEVA